MKMAAPALKADRPAYKPIPDLSIEATRAELTPAAIEAFLGLSRIWRLTSRQAIALLGEGSERTWFRIKAKEWVNCVCHRFPNRRRKSFGSTQTALSSSII